MGLRIISICVFIVSCTTTTLQKYSEILDIKKGIKKSEIMGFLGRPVSCVFDSMGETCEFRTLYARNLPVAAVYQKNPTLCPDLSPYEFFDVLSLHFDEVSALKDWKPIYLN